METYNASSQLQIVQNLAVISNRMNVLNKELRPVASCNFYEAANSTETCDAVQGCSTLEGTCKMMCIQKRQ